MRNSEQPGRASADGAAHGGFGVQTHVERSGRVRVVVHGELDLSTAEELKRTLHGYLSDGGRVLLDLSDVEFIDSAGLAVIVGALHVSTENGCQFRLSAEVQPQARRLMELTGVWPRLSLAEGPETADDQTPVPH